MGYIIFPLSYSFQFVLETFYTLTQNYGLAIIFLAILVSIVLLPLQLWADKLQQKDLDEKNAMRWALDSISRLANAQKKFYCTKEIYRRYGYNPIKSLRGLIGLLIQLPFFLAAYFMLGSFSDFSGQSFLIIKDLATPDALLKGYNFLPLFMTLVNLLSAGFYLLPKNNVDRSAMVSQLLLPMLFLMLLYNKSSALLLYWTCNNLFSLAKNYCQSRAIITAITKEKQIFSFRFWTNFCANVVSHRFCLPITVVLSGILLALYGLMEDRLYAHKLMKFNLLVLDALIVIILYQYRAQLKKILTQNFGQIQVVIAIILLFNLVAFHLHKLFGLALFTLTNDIPSLVFSQILALLLIRNILIPPSIAYRLFYQFRDTIKSLLSFEIKGGCYIIGVFLLQIFLYTPAIIYFKAPLDFGQIEFHIVLWYFISCISITILLSRYISKWWLGASSMKKHIKNFCLIAIVFITMVNFFYGYIYQLDLGIIRGLRFVNEKALTELPKSTLILELILLCVAFLLFIRFGGFVAKFSRHISLTIGSIGLVLLANVWLQNIDEIKKSFAPQEIVASEQQNSLDKTIANYFADNYEVFNFSKEKNILVLIFDAFPANMLEDIFKQNPEIKKGLDGFVWYKNTVSTGSATMNSINAMTGGPEYIISKINKKPNHDLTIQELTTKNWANLYNVIGIYDYDLSGAIPHADTSLFQSYLEQPFNKLIFPNINNFSNSFNYKLLSGLSLFKMSFLSLKRKIYDGGSWIKPIRETVVNDRYGHYKEYIMFKNMIQNLSYTGSKPTFKYFWTALTHRPFHFNKNGQWITSEDLKKGFDQYSDIDRKFTMEYALQKVIEIVQAFKDNDIYNQTKIIVASDHGGAEKDWNDWALYSLMMVKDFNSTGALQISDIPISNADIPAMIGTGVDPTGKFNTENNFGTDYTKEPDMDRILEYHIVTGEADYKRDTKYPAGKIISIQGDPYNRDNWQVAEFE